MLNLDIYRQPFRLLLPDEKGMYRTFLGSMLSILTIVTVGVFGVFKIYDLVNMTDYKVQTRELFSYYDQTEKFDAGDGFMVAAGIIGLDGID